MLPNLTWVPAIVILFPLVMPGPPRRMLAAAVAAGVDRLRWRSICSISRDASLQIRTRTFRRPCTRRSRIGFAYTGARIVYGLGREVTAARELGSYRLVERLGQGGMGEVWRAQHRLLARAAAIKLIRPSGTHDAPGASEDARRTVRAGGAGHFQTPFAAHDRAVRFRRRRRRRLLLRHGTPR